MIKGVNKHVIEISDTGNDCFERAILFVRPDSIHEDSDQIRRRAQEYLSRLRLRPWLHRKGKLVLLALGLLIAAAVGGLLTVLLLGL